MATVSIANARTEPYSRGNGPKIIDLGPSDPYPKPIFRFRLRVVQPIFRLRVACHGTAWHVSQNTQILEHGMAQHETSLICYICIIYNI